MVCKTLLNSQVQTTPVMCPIMKHLLKLTIFCKSALRSQVHTLLNCHVLSGTLTEADDVLQECAEIAGVNDTSHV